ncbi:hypothetical protein [Formosa sp. PL04]|uniref:hypothetical protein n=1 Tax=Formosa sp. PL04 TaxID=3081755 RepID=UPI002981B457|nr:hypothetical protein [Formosa sp. PL04]MDW5287488.1 hypothetical protein [Formosa sp. PL04]
MKCYFLLFLYMPLAMVTNLHEVSEFQNNQILDSKSVVDHAQWTILLSKYVTKDGQVNYEGFKDDEKELQDYFNCFRK